MNKFKLARCSQNTTTALLFLSIFKNNDRISELTLEEIEISPEAIELMIEVIRYQKIRNLKLAVLICENEEGFIEAACMNKNINTLRISDVRLPDIIYNVIFNCDHITDLRLDNTSFPPYQESLETHSVRYLTRLDIKKMSDIPETLFHAIKFSNSLKHVTIRSNYNSFRSISNILHLNTTLTKLSLLAPANEDFEILANGLAATRSLKDLEILTTSQSSVQTLCNALLLNKGVERLSIKVESSLKDSFYDSLNDLIAKKSSLRSIKFMLLPNKKAALNLIANLKNNDTLTHLDIVSHLYYTLDMNLELGNLFLDALKHNQTLNRITGINDVYDEVKIKTRLEQNKHRQDEFIRRAYQLTNMMKLRRETFENIFPVEIWAMIFERMRHPGVPINFSAELLARVWNE